MSAQTSASAPFIPQLPTSASTLDYALAYASAGLYILPVERGTKNPGSVVGAKWPALSSRDPQQVAAWFAGTDYGIALHAGRSGLVVIDVDYPDRIPAVLVAAFSEPHPIQQTRMGEPGRGHHLFRTPPGRVLGNSLGNLPKGWGDIRGLGGVIIVAPSVHPDAGGFYHWLATGSIPELPEYVARELPDSGNNSDSISQQTILEFIKANSRNERPTLLKAVLQGYITDTSQGGGRHDAMISALSWSMREAKLGYYPAQTAIEQIRELHSAMVGGERDVKAELLQALPWVIGQAVGDDSSTRGAGVEARTGEGSGAGSLAALERLTGKPVELSTPAAQEAPEAAADPLEALATPEGERDDFVPSWSAIDLNEYLDGTHEEITPELFMRVDGQCLLYRGRVHSFHGESESGKSWLGQIEVARVLAAGGTAAFIDYESNPASVTARLLLLGAPREALRPSAGRFHYLKPERAPWATGEAEDWAALLALKLDLVILDGVTEALSTMAISSNDNDELTTWIRAIPRKIAHSTGAALVMVDHVVKSREDGGRFAIGGQAKMAALDGAAFVVEIGRPLGKGLLGEIVLRLAKDREGALRGIAGAYRKSDRTQEIARVVIDSMSGTDIQVTVAMPQSTLSQGDGEVSSGGVESAGFRPTHVMETMSKFVETAPASPTGNTLTKDFAVNIDGSRKTRELALKLLVREEYLIAESGVRNSVVHKSLKPYRVVDDPLAPRVESITDDLNKLVGKTE